jgi:hypothetical protein
MMPDRSVGNEFRKATTDNLPGRRRANQLKKFTPLDLAHGCNPLLYLIGTQILRAQVGR